MASPSSLCLSIVIPTLSGNWCEAHLVPFEELLWLPHHWRGVAHLPTAQFTARGVLLTLEKKKIAKYRQVLLLSTCICCFKITSNATSGWRSLDWLMCRFDYSSRRLICLTMTPY